MGKSKSRASLLLKIVSVILIVYAVYFAATCVIDLVNGAFELKLLLPSVASVLFALLAFYAGYLGFTFRKPKTASLVGLIMLVIGIVSVVLSVLGAGFAWQTLGTLIIPVLYWLGIRLSKSK